MLPVIYTELGFFGTIALALGVFALFVLWLAGIAGIAGLPANNATRNAKMVISFLIPVFPILWLISDIVRQHRVMKTGLSR